jgi:hypothetical protein
MRVDIDQQRRPLQYGLTRFAGDLMQWMVADES